jgi:hypothetical protein
MSELSGPIWVQRFPTSVSVEELSSPFRENLKRFLQALSEANAKVHISATYRPVERAFLMHYAWKIANDGMSPAGVPSQAGIDINWVHQNLTSSRHAAQQMVDGYGMAHIAALNSEHTARRAVDMTISWTGPLSIRESSGTVTKISTSPRTGMNQSLAKVGKTYGVIKLMSDPPHWSLTGK